MSEPERHDPQHAPKWKYDGVRVIPGHALDPNTPLLPGSHSRRSQIDRTYLGINHVGGRCAKGLTFVDRINPGDVFGALDRRDVEINHNCLVVGAHQHAFQDLIG